MNGQEDWVTIVAALLYYGKGIDEIAVICDVSPEVARLLEQEVMAVENSEQADTGQKTLDLA